MKASFLQRYLASFSVIQGWFDFDAALMFMAYNQLRPEGGKDGDVLEIGAYQGLSSIGVATLRGAGKRFVIIDPFENSSETNIQLYGTGIRALFERNFAGFYPDNSFLTLIGRPSTELTAAELGTGFTFCHIDGGHTPEETYNDLALCCGILDEGGLIALDDYFNPRHPGVCEGALEFFRCHRGVIRPLAIGYSKLLFQKGGAEVDLNERFLAAFPAIGHERTTMWDSPIVVLVEPLRRHIDLYGSTPNHFMPFGAAGARVVLRPTVVTLNARAGSKVVLDVEVHNKSGEQTPSGKDVFGLSYHLLAATGDLLKHDNERAWIITPLQSGERRLERLTFKAPEAAGRYILEIDLVWEGVMWFRDIGNPTPRVNLIVA